MMIDESINILIVEDQTIVRGMLSDRLQSEPGFSVVGSLGSANDLIRKVVELRPHIILMDINMPGRCPFATAKEVRRLSQRPLRIIFLSEHTTDGYIHDAMDAGASGYVSKSESIDRFIQGIRHVSAGGKFFSKAIEERLICDSTGIRPPTKRDTRLQALTSREMEVMKYKAQEMTHKEIAELINVSPKTVAGHVTHLMAKLNIHTAAGLTAFAIREKLIEP